MATYYSAYARVPVLGDCFFEYGGVTRGRIFIDGSLHKWGVCLWAGALHMSFDLTDRAAKLIAAAGLAATLAWSFTSTQRAVAEATEVSMADAENEKLAELMSGFDVSYAS